MRDATVNATDDGDKPLLRVSRQDRTLWISGPISADMSDARVALHDLTREASGATVTLVINTEGGSINGAFAVMDAMERARRAWGVQFIGIAEGLAASAGLILLQACDRRLMGRWTTLVAHGFTFGTRSDITDVELRLGIIKAQTRHVAELFARHTEPVTGADADEWFDALHSKRDASYRASDALREGLVDEVIG